MNKTILVGRLTRDPNLTFTPGSGLAVCKFTLAVNRMKKKDGNQEADFINCIAFNKAAETIANYAQKGHLFGICGRIQTGSYMNKDNVRGYTTDVIVDEFDFLQSKNSQSNAETAPDYENDVTPVDNDEDIPF